MRNLLLATLAFHLIAGAAHSQTRRGGESFIAVRAGTNLVGNTYRVGEQKPEPGAGAAFGTFLSPYWALEFETWVRRANPECCGPKHREMLFSASVVRQLTTGGLQPYMLGGLTFLQADDPEMQVQVGVGAQFPLWRQLSMSVDLRGNGGGSTMIVRPTAALIYYFH